MRTPVKKYFHKNLIVTLALFMVISCDKEVSHSPVEAEPSKGFIYISSTPSGFTIFQNRKNTGRITPDSLSFLEPGNYEITLKRKYYKDTLVTVDLSEDEKVQVLVDYLSNPSMYGKLFLNTEPQGASIILNDSIINQTTPFTISGLLPGEYNVKFKLFNHRDSEITAIVQSDQTKTYSEELRDTSVWVDYRIFNSGIQTNTLSAIAIDQDNVKWIGTPTSGLISYDEITFTNYNKTNSSIPDDRINCISIDSQNKVWIGTNSGIGIFDGNNNWTVFNSNNSGLTTEIINTIHFDNSGNAWIGTAGNLVKYDGINWTVYNESQGRDWVEDMFIESQNKIWLATREDGIFIFQDEVFLEFSQLQYEYPTYSLSSVAPDLNGNIWFSFLSDTSGRGGVSYWDGSSFTSFFPGNSANTINSIFIDAQNNKWVSTSQGFIVYDPLNIQQVFNTQNSLITSDITVCSVKDQNGNVWVTTQSAGLNKYKPPQ